MPVLDLVAVKRHLNITSSGQDDELLDTLAAAEAVVEGIVGALAPRSVTETHRGGGTTVLLRQLPVLDVTAVTVDDAVLVEPDVDVEAGLLHLPRASARATVAYRTGYLDLPPDIKRAVLEVTAGLWRSQRGASPLPLQGGEAPDSPPQYASLISPAARELLAPYRRDTPVVA